MRPLDGKGGPEPRKGLRMRTHLRIVTVTLAVSGVLATAPAEALGQAPPTLTGVTLNALSVATTGTCNRAGTSTFSYTTSGTATAPYLGTFTESGSFSFGPQTTPVAGSALSGQLLTFTATFTITSGTMQVTGSKQLVVPAAVSLDARGFCNDPNSDFCNTFARSTNLAYSATISAAGQFSDQGTSTATVCDDTPEEFLLETFTSSQTVTTPVTNARFAGISARSTKQGVLLRWRTASEIDTLGFTVYREINGKRVRLSAKLIAANGRGSYSFLDRKAPKAHAIHYWVQVVNLDGTRSWYGPARVSRS